jgi:hypothetical protein
VFAQSPAQWLAARRGKPEEAAHDFAGIVFELRQHAALLDAHRLPLQLEGGPAIADGSNAYLLESCAAADPAQEPPSMYAHEAAGLGVVAVTVAQRAGARMQVLAHGYPMSPQGLGALLADLADRHGLAPELRGGPLVLDAAGQLGAPAATLH